MAQRALEDRRRDHRAPADNRAGEPARQRRGFRFVPPAKARLLLCVAAACGALLLVVTMATVQLLAARAHLLRGVAQLTAAEAALRSPAVLQSPASRRSLDSRLTTAIDEFSQARADLSAWEPLLDRLGWLPRVGPELSAAPPAADAAYFTARSAHTLESALAPVAGLLAQTGQGHRLERLTALLGDSQSRLDQARDDANRAMGATQAMPSDLGNARLNELAARLRKRLPELQQATAWLALSPRLLGAVRPEQYLFAWENPAEIRATGGFIGANDLITLRRGRISNYFHGNALPHQITTASLPLPEAYYTPEDYWLFCDSNWSPDFPLSARLERWFYGEDTGIWVPTVIDFLDPAIRDILAATGPVYLPGYRVWVNPSNVQALAQLYVHGHYHGPMKSPLIDTVRKQFFAAVLQALVKRVEHLPFAAFPRLGTALAAAIARRDILLFDERPDVEAAISSIGADGAMRAPRGDALYVVDDNRSYNKLNPYIDETAQYQARVQRDLRIQATLRIRYHVNPSPADLEGFGPDWGRWGTKHDYQDFLRVFVPRGSRLESMTGADPWAPYEAYGMTQFAGRILVRQGQTAVVTLRYTVPANALEELGGDTYELTLRRQPGANLRTVRVLVTGAPGVRIGAAGSLAHKVSLAHDGRVSGPVSGNLRPAPVTLGPPVFSDPYIPYSVLVDPRHPL